MEDLMMYSKALLCLGLCAASAPVSFADTLRLKDGRTIEGTFVSGNGQNIRFTERGRSARWYRLSEVDSLWFGNSYSSSGSTSGTYSSGTSSTGGSYDRRDDRYSSADRSRNTQYNDRIAEGATVTVRMIDSIDSDKNDAGQTFRASLDEPLTVNGRTIAAVGSDATVRLVQVDKGNIADSEEVTLELTEIRANGRTYRLETGPAQVSQKTQGRETAKVVGGTAVVGAIIGAIAGGGKGAAIGAAAGAGAGAAVQAIRGQRVKIPSETTLDFHLTRPLMIQ
jgi:hypothetical protein